MKKVMCLSNIIVGGITRAYGEVIELTEGDVDDYISLGDAIVVSDEYVISRPTKYRCGKTLRGEIHDRKNC